MHMWMLSQDRYVDIRHVLNCTDVGMNISDIGAKNSKSPAGDSVGNDLRRKGK